MFNEFWPMDFRNSPFSDKPTWTSAPPLRAFLVEWRPQGHPVAYSPMTTEKEWLKSSATWRNPRSCPASWSWILSSKRCPPVAHLQAVGAWHRQPDGAKGVVPKLDRQQISASDRWILQSINQSINHIKSKINQIKIKSNQAIPQAISSHDSSMYMYIHTYGDFPK